VDHINGKKKNNAIENLQPLTGKVHSQKRELSGIRSSEQIAVTFRGVRTVYETNNAAGNNDIIVPLSYQIS
jgi:hypothetical protein